LLLLFQKIVGIYEVLKDPVKRARYNNILEHGMPDWRTPMYYFRKVRKLTTIELSIAISIIISIGHYCVLYAQHFEMKLTIVLFLKYFFCCLKSFLF
jgi:DnaJ homolog subfamily C member 1